MAQMMQNNVMQAVDKVLHEGLLLHQILALFSAL